MSRIGFSIISFILIALISVFAYMAPNFFGQKGSGENSVLNELVNNNDGQAGRAGDNQPLFHRRQEQRHRVVGRNSGREGLQQHDPGFG
jgi:hypothetical protein